MMGTSLVSVTDYSSIERTKLIQLKVVNGQKIYREIDFSTINLNDSNPDYYFIKSYGIKQIQFSNPFFSNLLYKYKNPRYMKIVLNYNCLFTAF